MLNTKQQKKSNNNIRYSISGAQPSLTKLHGVKLKKSKPIKDPKIPKNMSQLPISFLENTKENISMSNLMIARPYSSLVGSDVSNSVSKSKSKYQRTNSKIKKGMKKLSTKKYTIGIDNQNQKGQLEGRRLSGPTSSFHNFQRQNRSIIENDSQLKRKMAEKRKKYNLSCGDMIDEKNKSKSKEKLKLVKRQKKGSKLSPKKSKNKLKKTNNSKSINAMIIHDGNKSKKFIPVNKSKGNTANTIKINIQKKIVVQKKKGQKNKKSNQKKTKKSIKKLFVFSKEPSEWEGNSENRYLSEFPINKYSVNNQQQYESTHKMVNYNYPGLILSGSSVLNGYEISKEESSQQAGFKDQTKLIRPNNERNLIFDDHSNEESDDDINVEEIKIYENNSPIKEYSNINFHRLSMYSSSKTSKSKQNYGMNKVNIFKELEDQYVALNSQQLQFLTAIVMIQRKWRQYKLHKQLRNHVNANVTTEYIIDQQSQEHEKKNIQVNQNSQSISRNKNSGLNEKDAMMSQTKLVEEQQEGNQQKFIEKVGNQKLSNSPRANIEVSRESLASNVEDETKLEIKRQEIEDDWKFQQSPEFGLVVSQKSRKSEHYQLSRSDNTEYVNEFIQLQNQCQEVQGPLETENKGNIQTVNYLQIYSNQIFPDLTYLQYRVSQFKSEFQHSLNIIQEEKSKHRINKQQFEQIKQGLVNSYNQKVENLKKTKHDIKKGYLKYIDCINTLKQIKRPFPNHKKKYRSSYWAYNQKSESRAQPFSQEYAGLRRVSSQNGFISILYDKLFQFDSCLSQWSKGSSSIQLLSKKILVRKEFYEEDGEKVEKRPKRSSLNDLKGIRQNKNSIQLFKSECGQNPNTLTFDQAERIEFSDGFEQLKQSESVFLKENQDQLNNTGKIGHISITGNQQIEQNLMSEEMPRQQLIRKQNLKIKINEEYDGFMRKQQSIKLTPIQQRLENALILQLARQLETQLHKINPSLIDIVLISMMPLSSQRKSNEWYQEQSEDDQIGFDSVIGMNRHIQQLGINKQQVFGHQSELIEKQEQMGMERDAFDQQSTIIYLQLLIDSIISPPEPLLSAPSIFEEILNNINSNQSFQPLTYLKFLRDFQIPEDQYQPIIGNEHFVEWQNYFINTYDPEEQNDDEEESENYFNQDSNYQRQAKAIYHRCIFEAFMTQLEKNRPYGERGRPFPWEENYSCLHIKQIQQKQIPIIFKKCLKEIMDYTQDKCGIISEKYPVNFEYDLQRLHEENQDRVIDMLEKQLRVSKHKWYEIEEHILQINLQLSFQLEMQMICEVCEEIVLQRLLKRQRK